MIIISGQKIVKKSMSRKSIVIVRVVALPIFIPSRFRNIMLNAEPPTEDGVMADVNSQRKVILNDFFQLRSFRVKTWNRQAMPPSLSAIAINAHEKPMMDNGVSLTLLRASGLKSLLKRNMATTIPIITGMAILP